MESLDGSKFHLYPYFPLLEIKAQGHSSVEWWKLDSGSLLETMWPRATVTEHTSLPDKVDVERNSGATHSVKHVE